MKTPAEIAIKALGGQTALAKITGRTVSAVSQWKKTGLIPGDKTKRALLKAAKRQGVELTEKDLIWGRK